MVYYRKYRPQTISSLDLDRVREKLTAILSSGDLPHAFLFSGPKGLGKTSAARILAKAINCKNRMKDEGKREKSIEPCNKCEICLAITNGSHIDVLEIDAASNRGIDEIRELRDRIKYAPSELEKKIYIIDEVHMLTTEAFNALLKTLEEPPEHAVFILATTEPWKLLPTIVSRTFEVNFEKPTTQQIANSLSRIVEGEGLKVEDGVLEQIAAMSDGAFRDAAKNLEELAVSSNGKKITKETMDEVFKTSSMSSGVEELLSALSNKDAKTSFEIIQKLSDQGIDYRLFIEEIVEQIRQLLHEKVGIRKATSSTHLSTKDLERLAGLFNEAYKGLRGSVLPQLPLELVVLRWCVLEQNQESRVMNQTKVVIPVKTGIQTAGGTPGSPIGVGDDKKEKTDKLSPVILNDSEESKIPRKQDSSSSTQNDNGEFLYQLIDAIKHENAQIAGLLRGCSIEKMGDEEVVISTKFEFHGKKLNEQKSHELLTKAASDLLSKSVKIVVVTRNETRLH